ncbi:MAG: hypothetical protein J2P57_25225, partial [Acidimicrobiaceae bacterium]|nr:hypothetical protein [Acidimicrobiaceae bacterium]
IIRRVWLGEPQGELVARQREFYRRARQALPDDQTVTTADPIELAERLAQLMAVTGGDALNLRVHLPGISPAAIRDQIEWLCAGTLPRLRELVL